MVHFLGSNPQHLTHTINQSKVKGIFNGDFL